MRLNGLDEDDRRHKDKTCNRAVVVFWPIHLLSTRRDRLREEPEAASGEEAGEWPYFLAKTGYPSVKM